MTSSPNTDEILPLASSFEPVGRDQWLALIDKVIKGADFERRLVASTADGLKLQPLYTQRDNVPAEAIGEAGSAPFTRGARTEAEGLGWEIRQLHAAADPKAANTAILEDLAGGVGGIALRVEAPGHYGLPATVDAMATALDGVYLDMVPVALDAGESYHAASGNLMAVWRQRKVPAELCQAAFNADPLGVLARTGALSHDLARATTAAARFAADPICASPKITALLADGRAYHEAGASEAQELASMLATAVAYLRAMEREGLDPASALPRIGFALAADAELMLTVAKLRAARRLVWRVADAAGAGKAAKRMRLWVSTSERMMAKRDPWVNMLRTTAACAGAVIGGANAVTVLPFTWALGQPDAFARRIARNTHVLLQEESGLGRVVDPAGGSYAVERLTDDLTRKAWSIFQEIEAEGGMGAALKGGLVQDQIAAVADARERSIATGKIELTGVSTFPRLGDDGVKIDPHPAVTTVARSGEIVTALAPRRLGAAFERLRDAAEATQPRIFFASLGQLADHSVRSTWMQNYLAAGGIGAITSEGFSDTAAVGRAFAESGASIACICSSDAVYAELAEAAAMALKGAGAKRVYLAGRPRDQEAALKAAGVDGFIFAGADALATLQDLHRALGIAV